MNAIDPTWPPVGGKVAIETDRGAKLARVIAYFPTKGEVRVRFDDERFNTFAADCAGKTHRIFRVDVFLRLVKGGA